LFGWGSGFEGMDLNGLSGLCVDERIVWINGWMVKFERISRDWL